MATWNMTSESDNEFTLAPVIPSHTITDRGVRFNVQTVDSLGAVLPVMNTAETLHSIETSAISFYEGKKPQFGSASYSNPISKPKSCKLEAHSVSPNRLVRHGASSLAHIALTAFANHYPLMLRPDDIWLAIACGAAKHIDKNAEALRSRFVSFQGKRKLRVRIDHAIMGQVPKHDWEEVVFRNFSHQIRKHVGEGIHSLITGRFSTTTKADKAAAEITLMASLSKYFECQMFTLCGIPTVELHGSLEDWKQLRKRAEELKSLLLDDFAYRWMNALLPVLDQFVAAYKGNVNHEFWQRMVKKTILDESGRYASLSGWIINLYPYLSDGSLNRYMMPWQQMRTCNGPEPEEIPSIISSAPVSWNYYDQKFPLHFHAGILGMVQDQESRSLQPYVGWYVTHDPIDTGTKSCSVGRKTS